MTKTDTTKTQAEILEGFKGRLRVVSFLRPGEVAASAKLNQVTPVERCISQSRLAAVDELRTGVLMCLKAWELCQESLTDDVRRGVPVEDGRLTPFLTKNSKGNDVVYVKAVL